ncbi:Spy/CpxP family protein refolding chaperone [Thiomonas sp. FB-Cd]|uniref:Spy/CpxP family protein refolding chaperone n=1 Tax=Thiomonas sp. FB-Cd TaxID=1158292 RepID=UPI00068FC9C2|nr:Spy/CpxP family protein refolding chaperone [Thiomonas sp. FB-Cd]
MNHPIRIAMLPAMLALAFLSPVAGAQSSSSTQARAPSSKVASTTRRAERRENLVEQRIVELHKQLEITLQEAPQWNAFALTMRQNADAMEQAFRERMTKMPTMNADEVMKSYANMAALNAQNVQKLSASFSDLYGVLSPNQKAIADRLFRHEPRRLRKAPVKK